MCFIRWNLYVPWCCEVCDSPLSLLGMKDSRQDLELGMTLPFFPLARSPVFRLMWASLRLLHMSRCNLMNYADKQGYVFWILTSLSAVRGFEIYKDRWLSSQMKRFKALGGAED